MPPVIAAAGLFLQGVGIAVASAVGGLAAGASLGIGAAVALGGAVVAGAALVASKAVNSLFAVDMPQVDSDASRQRTVKSTTEPFKTIYGETLVSGPITYIGMAGTDNADLYHVIALAGHEVTDIKDVYFDNKLITDAQINSGNAAGGNVIAGDFGPKGGSTICVINKHLGTATQAADSMMVSTFSDYTSAHQGKNVAYIAMKWTLNQDSGQTWEQFAPSDIKAIVQGRKVYDPRLDVTAGNAAGANPTDASYIAYSTNPALCLADYLINSEFGLGVAADKVDWAAIVTAADGCDVSVVVPGGTQSRYSCNGVLFGTDSHRTNINKILSSMNGTLVYSNGVYILRAGIYEAPTQSLNEDDLIGAIGIKTSFERSDRFNTIKGLFVDPAQNHKSSEFPKVQLADAVTRDNGEVLTKEMQFPMTNSSYGAQRIANKLIQLSDQQKVVTFPANLSALRITAGDRVQVSVEELSWSNKIFQCVGWTFADDGGVNLTLREDSSTSYADPASNEYSTITATGDITDAFRGVPSPSGLSATAGLKSNELNWVNPARPSDFGTIHVFASPNANFSSAVKIGETDGTQFSHDAANAVDAVSPGDVRYYWVRAIKNVGTDAASQSNLEPNADPNTTVFSTVGRVNWSDVAGTTGAPTDSATVGAQISVNLYDADGSTVMGQSDVKNSVLAQEILEVEIEAGEVLNLETGADVDIQNLGDVAIYVSNQDAVLQGNINTVSLGLSNLENTIVDLTSGVSDIYIQTTAPVPGQGGIPNPIPDFSRWYDSDDDNHPYYWTGSAWVSLEDPRIASNASAITNLTSNLATTDGNVSGNSTSITALDTLTVAQGTSITTLSGAVTALESTVDNATTGVSANATGLSSLTTRVSTAEGTITTQSSDISTLTADLDQAEVDIGTKAASTALTALDVRVTSAEGTITTHSTDITALESTVDGANGVVANASGLSALTTRVQTAEGEIDTNASAVTTLDATYTSDLNYRTKAADENNDLIDLETSGTVDLQELTDFVSGSSAATQALTVRTTASEDSLVTQASDITALQSTVNDPANGVSATATGLSNLSTSVSVIDGTVSTISSDLTSLTTTVGGNTTSISTQSDSIDGVEANYTVKIDNNNRIAGFGLLSTTSGSTPFSEFAVIADQFSIVDPSSTTENPIQPFTVSAQKVYFGTDVIVSGDLISTGTISADRLQIDNVMFDTETVEGVTSLIIKTTGVDTAQIAESAITTARLSNDAVTVDKFANTLESTNYVADTSGWQILTSGNVEFQNAKITGEINATSGTLSSSIAIGTGDNIFKADSNGIYLGDATFADAPFRVSPGGAVTATGVNITGTVDASTALTFNGANVTGTLAAANLDVSGIITSGSLVTDSATIANDIRIGSGEAVFSADSAGIYLGNETFADAEFRVTPAGALTASSATLTGNVTASSFTLATGATLSDADGAISNAQQLMSAVTGVVDAAQHNIPSFWRITTDDNEAPSNTEFNSAAGRLAKVNDLVITTDTTVTDPVTPDRTYGWTCTTAGATSTEAVWSAITNFMSGDLLVDGSVSADQINASSVASAVITAGSLIVEDDLTNATTIISGANILTGVILADYIDVSGVITAGALITDSATIANDIRIGSGDAVFSADSAGIYLGNTTFDDAEFRVTPAGALTASGATISGAITATSLSLDSGVTIGTTNLSTGVNTSLGLADSANQNDDATILSGNLTGTVNSVAVADVTTGASAGASAVQPSDTDLDLGIQTGAIGPITIAYTPAADGNPEVAQLYQGTGTFNNANTGFYLDNSANFSLKNKLAFDGTDLTVSGAITASSLTLESGVTIGSTGLSTAVNTSLGKADSANQDSTATILGGDLTGTVNSVAVSDVTDGASSGASAVQPSDTGLDLGIQTGAIGPVTIAYTAASGSDPEVAQLYQGTGTFNNANTGFYLDNSANFSLKNKLSFDGTDLTVSGAITATSLTLGSGVTIGSTGLSTAVNTSLSKADSSNQDSTATILGGNLTGTVNSVAVDDVTTGAASGASAVQPSDTDLDLGIQTGAIGPITIAYTAAAGGNPEVAQLYQGTGTFNNANTGFYFDNSANFSLKDKLSFDGTDLTIAGDVTASSFTLSSGASLSDADGVIANADQVMSDVTGVVSADQHQIPSFWRVTTDDDAAPDNAEFNTVAGRLAKVNDLVISLDTTTTPDTTYAWICTVAGAASTEATWSAITNFISGDLIVDGSVKAEAIAANAVTAEKVNVTSLSAISADMGTITAGTIKTAATGYRVEVSDTGDFPIWYGTGTKTEGNGLFYVKSDGSVYINAVVSAQAGSTVALFDVAVTFSTTAFGQSNTPVTVTTSANDLTYAYSNGSGNYTYSWSHLFTLSGGTQTISSTTIEKPTFSATVARNVNSINQFQVIVTDTDTGATSKETIFVELVNVGAN